MSIATVILVHGALLTSQSWLPVQDYLQKHEINVISMDVPGRAGDKIDAKSASLDLAAKKLCKIVKQQTGPVILAAHSQGGAVITQAVGRCGRHINGLIYITAVVPHNGEKAFDLLGNEDNQNFEKVASLNEQRGEYQINTNAPIKEMFMADAENSKAKFAIEHMVAEPARIGDDKLHYSQAIFDSIPKFYIKTSNDKIILPATQDKYIQREKFAKVYVLESSHSPFVSQPETLGAKMLEVAQLIQHSSDEA